MESRRTLANLGFIFRALVCCFGHFFLASESKWCNIALQRQEILDHPYVQEHLIRLAKVPVNDKCILVIWHKQISLVLDLSAQFCLRPM
jgi:hypothetical protein